MPPRPRDAESETETETETPEVGCGGLWPPVRLPTLALAAVVGIWVSGELSLSAGAWFLLAAVALAVHGVQRGRGSQDGSRRRASARAVGWILIAGLVAAGLGARAREPMAAPAGVGVDDRESDVVEGWVSGPIATNRVGVSFAIETAETRIIVLADGHGGVLPGDRVRVTGRVIATRGYRNPGSADRMLAAQARGAPWEVRAKTVERVAAADRVSAWRWPAVIARAASERVATRGGHRTGNALVRAAVLGDRSALDEDTDASWRAAGVYHALSVSGLHLAAVALVVFVTVGWTWTIVGLGTWIAPRRAAAACALPAAVVYTLVTGAQIATMRALLVVAVFLIGELIDRRARAADALGFAALVVLAFDPLALHDPGFQLSFVAAATLIVAARRRDPDELDVAPRTRARRIAAAIGRALVTSTAVALATAPITAWHFHEIALGGAIGNLIVTPLVELVTIPLGLAGLGLSVLSPAAGGVVLDAAIAVAGLTADIVVVLGGWTPSLVVPPPSAVELLAVAALYGAWAWRGGVPGGAGTWSPLAPSAFARWARFAPGVLAIAAAGVLAGSWGWHAHARDGDDALRITFLDVGQGDAAVIELPGGEVWLVDAGGAPGVTADVRVGARPGEEVARFLRQRRIARVAVAVVSHPHPDHYLGLVALAPRIDLGELWVAAEDADLAANGAGNRDARDSGRGGIASFEDVARWLGARGVRVVHPALGAHRRGDVTIRVLAPRHDPGDGVVAHAAADPVRSVNDNSLVIAVERAGTCVLFTGDLEAEGEEALVQDAGGELACDVVKVAHHGSATSSSAALVAATRPAWAVVSLGRGNRFGFPAPDVVARWEAAGARVLRTDEAGAVTATIGPTGTLQIATRDPP